MKFWKYHALGNDYIVLDSSQLLTEKQIRTICHRNYGVGSDGVLCWSQGREGVDFTLRIFNPDGSEAEKSGNGIRIFARFLWDQDKVGREEFSILTAGGLVKAKVHKDGRSVTVDMGRVSFDSTQIPVTGPRREVINETMEVEGQIVQYCAATIGNPHCVLLCDEVSEEKARLLGPAIECDPCFPNRTNVQLMKVIDRRNIRIEIWERGAGYTLASGSSSCAAAAVASKLDLCGPDITVHMPGGEIEIVVGDDFSIQMTGPVTRIAEGVMSDEIFE